MTSESMRATIETGALFQSVTELAAESASALKALRRQVERMIGTFCYEVPIDGRQLSRVQFDWMTGMTEWNAAVEEAIRASQEVQVIAGRARRVAQRAGDASVRQLTEVEARLALYLRPWFALLVDEEAGRGSKPMAVSDQCTRSARPVIGHVPMALRQILMDGEIDQLGEWNPPVESAKERWMRISERMDNIADELEIICWMTCEGHAPFTSVSRLQMLSQSLSSMATEQAGIWAGLDSLTTPLGDPELDRHDALLQLEVDFLASQAVPPPGHYNDGAAEPEQADVGDEEEPEECEGVDDDVDSELEEVEVEADDTNADESDTDDEVDDELADAESLDEGERPNEQDDEDEDAVTGFDIVYIEGDDGESLDFIDAVVDDYHTSGPQCSDIGGESMDRGVAMVAFVWTAMLIASVVISMVVF